ncbi:MAG TPA: signal peptidase I [Jiangellales bacterium]|nr:signal peptidase I [Jiangellales bacterium]
MADDTADGERATGERPSEAGHPERGGGFLAVVRETVIVVVLSLLIATLVRIFLVQAFLIPSQSMEQTLLVGDRVLVSKLSTRFGGEVERGDVVVFEDPGGWLGPLVPAPSSTGLVSSLRDGLEFVGVLPDDAEGHLIKRVVAVGGDTVACCDDQGRLTVNGVAVEESEYLHPGDVPSTTDFEEAVPPGAVYVMGDHRANSGDSRVHGMVPEESITGRAFAVVWPVSRWQRVDRPDAFEAVPER